MKKVLSLILSLIFVVGICPTVFASEPIRTQESVRVWNTDAEILVELTGTAGADVSVVVLKPGVNMPDLSTDLTTFNDGVQHIRAAKLDENGRLTFGYTAEDTGVYSIYVTGASIAYTATNNAASVTNPDRIYVESWRGSGEYTHPDLSYITQITKSMLDVYSAEDIAKSVWERLEAQPEGRRTIFINRDLSPYTNTPDYTDNRIWWDEGAEIVACKLDAFFKAMSAIPGATVDFLYADMEHNHSMYESSATVLNVANHERYPELRAELAIRGYDFSVDGSVPLSSISTATDKYTHSIKKKNLAVYNAACSQLAHEYFNEAIYYPAKKYFANVKYAEYAGDASKPWPGKVVANRGTYVGGNVMNAGTHAAPPIYSKGTKVFEYDFVYGIPGETGSSITRKKTYSGAGTDFKELQGNIGLYRLAESAMKDGAITPWIATETVQSEDSFVDSRYRAEMVMHLALHNPDRMLHYNPGTDETTTADEQSEILMTILDEVNGLIAYPDRRSLNVDQADLSLPFAISGIYSNGRNLWRITPDTETVTDFLASEDADMVVFITDEAMIMFPEGAIVNVPDTNSDIGYWVETAKGVNPIIEYVDQSTKEEAIISFYDVEYGQKADIATEAVVDAVASFKGYYGSSGLMFVAAKYDENGTLIDVETKECGILASYGNASFIEISKDLDTDKIKFYLWENDTIRPIAEDKEW